MPWAQSLEYTCWKKRTDPSTSCSLTSMYLLWHVHVHTYVYTRIHIHCITHTHCKNTKVEKQLRKKSDIDLWSSHTRTQTETHTHIHEHTYIQLKDKGKDWPTRWILSAARTVLRWITWRTDLQTYVSISENDLVSSNSAHMAHCTTVISLKDKKKEKMFLFYHCILLGVMMRS